MEGWEGRGEGLGVELGSRVTESGGRVRERVTARCSCSNRGVKVNVMLKV